MKCYLPLFFFIAMLNSLKNIAQNLVPNPSFESYTSCPHDVGQIDSAIGWTVYGNGQWWGPSTPDLYNVGAVANQYPDSFVSIPYNWCGYQQPADGNAYVGIVCYAITVQNFHEIIGCHLISPLEVGQTYYVSFKANCSFGGVQANYLATNGLGAKFSTIPFSNTNPMPIDNNPMIYSSAVITDTMNWTTIEGSFISDSAYQYLAIGNFVQDANLDTVHLGSFIFRSYYFIDDVCVSNTESGCLIANGIDNLNTNNFDAFPNPASDGITVIIAQAGNKQILVRNYYGQIVYQKEENFSQGETILINIRDFPAGMYFIVLNGEREIQQQSLLIEH